MSRNTQTSLIKDTRHRTIFWMSVTCILVSLPFISAKFPPITDLSQLVAQVPLFWDALLNDNSAYEINWLVPHSLAHFLFVATVGLFGHEYGGTYAMWLLSISQVVSFFWLADHFKRPMYTAVLSSTLIFSLNLYWGFSAFLIGWPIFVAYLIQVSESYELTKKNTSVLIPLVALLYFSHLLWFIVAGLWLVIYSTITRKGLRATVRQCGIFIPLAILMILWKYSIRTNEFDRPLIYLSNPIERTIPIHLVDSLGGLRGTTGILLMSVIFFIIAIAFVQNRSNQKQFRDQTLLITACLFLGLYLLLPDIMTSTLALNTRWLPYGIGCLILATPAVQVKNFVIPVICVVTLFALSLTTRHAWHQFETREMKGFDAVLSALPRGQKVIGLDFERTSDFIKGFPFMHMFTFAQIQKDATMNISFAEFPTSFVVYKNYKRTDDDKHLEWHPYRFEISDLSEFDYTIVHSNSPGLGVFRQIKGLEEVVREGNFGLYKIEASAPDPNNTVN